MLDNKTWRGIDELCFDDVFVIHLVNPSGGPYEPYLCVHVYVSGPASLVRWHHPTFFNPSVNHIDDPHWHHFPHSTTEETTSDYPPPATSTTTATTTAPFASKRDWVLTCPHCDRTSAWSVTGEYLALRLANQCLEH
ncbi:unnamed protein product [Schistocephalus solidus]|uniref:CULT domain-containing protein n=1 Tax=Schistocephalus solidus TaxID=70667 RepID=A0A183SM92_SCHSO|nr:unnamed protein product [Schistocephalus solidus]